MPLNLVSLALAGWMLLVYKSLTSGFARPSLQPSLGRAVHISFTIASANEGELSWVTHSQ